MYIYIHIDCYIYVCKHRCQQFEIPLKELAVYFHDLIQPSHKFQSLLVRWCHQIFICCYLKDNEFVFPVTLKGLALFYSNYITHTLIENVLMHFSKFTQ